MIEFLKKKDRILLEMHSGILLSGLLFWGIGAFFVEDQLRYAKSLWFGVLFAAVNCVQMARSLDRALANGSQTKKILIRGHAIRYAFIVCIMIVIAITDVLNCLVVFLGLMSLKLAAYLQPLFHKIYNRLFHETDPVPHAMPEEEELEESIDTPAQAADSVSQEGVVAGSVSKTGNEKTESPEG